MFFIIFVLFFFIVWLPVLAQLWRFLIILIFSR
jgi:hypothetical protein